MSEAIDLSTAPLPKPQCGARYPHFSETLAHMGDAIGLLGQLPICANCPAADWVRTVTTLECICQAFNIVMWTNKEPKPVWACDARKKAVQAEQDHKAQSQ